MGHWHPSQNHRYIPRRTSLWSAAVASGRGFPSPGIQSFRHPGLSASRTTGAWRSLPAVRGERNLRRPSVSPGVIAVSFAWRPGRDQKRPNVEKMASTWRCGFERCAVQRAHCRTVHSTQWLCVVARSSPVVIDKPRHAITVLKRLPFACARGALLASSIATCSKRVVSDTQKLCADDERWPASTNLADRSR